MATKLQGLILKELSLVDNPANSDAVVSVVKRKANDGEGSNMPTVEELQKSVEDLTKSLATAQTLAKMSDEEKDFMKEMDEDEKAEFMGMDDEQRKAKMSMKKSADATIEVNGAIVKRSVVGADMFAIIKSQQDQLAEIQKAAQRAKEEAEVATLTKRAAEEFPHLPGGAEATVALLKAAKSMPDAARDALDALMKAAEEAGKGNFSPVGKGNAGGGEGKSATDQLDDLAKRYAEEHKVSFAKAYTAVVESNPKLYQDTLTGSN